MRLILVCNTLLDGCIILSTIKTWQFYLRRLRFFNCKTVVLQSDFQMVVWLNQTNWLYAVKYVNSCVLLTCEPLPFQRVTDSFLKQSTESDGIFCFRCQLHQLNVSCIPSKSQLQRTAVKQGSKCRRGFWEQLVTRGASYLSWPLRTHAEAREGRNWNFYSDWGGHGNVNVDIISNRDDLIVHALAPVWVSNNRNFLIFHCCISSCYLTLFCL